MSRTFRHPPSNSHTHRHANTFDLFYLTRTYRHTHIYFICFIFYPQILMVYLFYSNRILCLCSRRNKALHMGENCIFVPYCSFWYVGIGLKNTNVWFCWYYPRNWLTHWGRYEVDAISQTTVSDTFFLIESIWISIKISLKFIAKGPINNIPALVRIMAWRRPGDKPLSEVMMVRLLTHICVARPQWVNALGPKQNDHHFADDIFKCISCMKILVLRLKFHWNLFARVQLIIYHH